MNNVINVCLSCDDNYSKYAGVLITSILVNSLEGEFLNFYILDGNISQENKQRLLKLKNIKNECNIEFIMVDEGMFELYKNVRTHKYVSVQTYYRLKIASLLPNIHRVIYLDCDMVVCESLGELWNYDLGENVIAGALDARVYHQRKWKNTNYINAGMILYDLDYIRRNKIENLFEEYTRANINIIKTGDQDIINYTLKDKIGIIDGIWNVQVSGFASRTNYTNYPNIIHYIGRDKPWIFGSNTYFKDRFFEYLQMSPWALTEKEQEYWITENKRVSRKFFWEKRPYAIIHPKYWYAFFCSNFRY